MRQIPVGPLNLTINHGRTFLVTDQLGEVHAGRAQGLFADDTRFISSYQIRLNGQPWELVSASTVTYFSSQTFHMNAEFETEAGTLVPRRSIALVLSRTLGEGLHEDYDLSNYASFPVHFRLEIGIDSDFADIFEVKTREFRHRGRISTTWDPQAASLHTAFLWEKFDRGLRVRADRNDSPLTYSHGTLTFDIDLAPQATWHTCLYSEPIAAGGVVISNPYDCYQFETGDTPMDRKERKWREVATTLQSSCRALTATWARSIEDLGALRMYPQDTSEELWVPAAGIPWFLALFGRDSLLTGIQSVVVYPNLAIGALKRLGSFQAHDRDPARDMEPGKILHERRVGPLATNGLIPHRPYYGTADASILYLIALSEAYKWTGDLELVHSCLPVAEACLRWIDEEGDRDGDGFQEYATTAPDGYRNMGWKDAYDAIVYPDGRLVDPPIALIELQGYVFDAKRRMAVLFEALGDKARSQALREQAEILRQRVEETFWLEDEGTYGLCLDPQKRLVTTVASNPGHLLWSGLPSSDHAARVVRRLLAPDMFSGWGIRTLSRANPAYNPLEYQRGSIWPHDNAIIALGMAHYGHHEAVSAVARALLEAAEHCQGNRLPELFAGFQRDDECHFPVQYVGANVPQAWSAASVFQLVQALLGLEADAGSGVLWSNPVLPEWLDEVRLSGIRVGQTKLDLLATRGAEGLEVLRRSDERVEVKAIQGA